mmetsp:Transcript_7922/g.11497  ORF Transcript_7922/g.11497 Transcript_7922/m.11497 type:complete len:164 (+) Transcript_7922:1138-1629(+)
MKRFWILFNRAMHCTYDAEEQLDTMAEKEDFDIDTKQSELLCKILSEVMDDGGEVSSSSGDELGGVDELGSHEERGGGTDITEEVNGDGGEEIEEEGSHAPTQFKVDDDVSDSSDDEAEKQVKHKEDWTLKAMEGQQQQARRVNAARGKDYKEVLEVGNICLI